MSVGRSFMVDHDEEIRRLRMSMRRLHILVVILFCAVIGAILTATRQSPVRADSVPDVLTTKKLVIVDSSGNQTVVIGSFAESNNAFQQYPGATMTGIGVFSNGSQQLAALGIENPAQNDDVHRATTLLVQSFDAASTTIVRSFGGSGTQTTMQMTSSVGSKTGQVGVGASPSGVRLPGE
jgi:hypothetical protein